MKRAGFTMIELIFVIVILGILAAVAVPKLAATRDDARISAEVASAATVIKNLGGEYTAKAAFATDSLTQAQAAVNCVTVTGTSDGNVSIAATVPAASAAKCPDSIKSLVWAELVKSGVLDGTTSSPATKNYIFGGTSVVR